MKDNDELKTLVKIVLNRVKFSRPKNTRGSKAAAENRAADGIELMVLLFRELAKGGGKEPLAKYLGIAPNSVHGLIYENKITPQHFVNGLCLAFNAKDSKGLSEKALGAIIDGVKEDNSNATLAKLLSLPLDQDEYDWLLGVAQKYVSLREKKKIAKKKRATQNQK